VKVQHEARPRARRRRPRVLHRKPELPRAARVSRRRRGNLPVFHFLSPPRHGRFGRI
jgi:hypothetical protein